MAAGDHEDGQARIRVPGMGQGGYARRVGFVELEAQERRGVGLDRARDLPRLPDLSDVESSAQALGQRWARFPRPVHPEKTGVMRRTRRSK